MNYEDDMRIDEDALDYEILEQPSLMVKYSTMLADARRDRDLAKEDLDYMKAQIDKEIRSDPSKFGLEKITEGAITNVILMEKKYRVKVEDFNDTNYEVNVLQGVVSAIDARKSALESLVRLHGQQYFAGPSVPHNLTELRQKKNDEIQSKIGKSLRKPEK